MIKVGIVDDEEIQVKIIKEFLEMIYGNNLLIVGYTDPFKIYEDVISHKDFDVLIVDNCMPKMEGIELVKQIRYTYKPYTVLISVLGELKIIKNRQLFDYTLSKPVNFERLTFVIDDVIEKVKNDRKLNEVIIRKDIEKLFHEKSNSVKVIKRKSFLKNVVMILLSDQEVFEGEVYKKLTKAFDRHETTIRKNLNDTINKIDNNALRKLGFENKPKCCEFLRKFTSRVEKDIKEREIRKVK